MIPSAPGGNEEVKRKPEAGDFPELEMRNRNRGPQRPEDGFEVASAADSSAVALTGLGKESCGEETAMETEIERGRKKRETARVGYK